MSSKITASATATLKTALILSVLIGTTAQAQFGGSRGPVTPEGFQAHWNRDQVLEAEKARVRDARSLADAQRDKIGDRERAGQYVSRAERARSIELESRLRSTQESYGAIRDAGIKPFLPPQDEPASSTPAQSREEIYRSERGGVFDERHSASLVQEPMATTAEMETLSAKGVEQAKIIKQMRLASSSLGGDLLEHIFPGKYEVRLADGGRRTLTGYGDRLDYLMTEMQTLENNPQSLAEFKKRNTAWLGRYSDAIAARQLMFDRNAARTAGKPWKHLSEVDALETLKQKAGTSVKADALGRWFTSIGGKSRAGAGIFGAVMAVAGSAVANVALAAGEAELAPAADGDLAPAKFSRPEFRPGASRQTSR